jgi:NhaP-type Na+/H+ and K+/H+ antiporter
MAVIILVMVLFVAFLIIQIGAVLLELTGMDRERAMFQAISAFTGTGFTTLEAESVVIHPTRRNVIIGLMLFGNAGIITVIGSMVASLWGRDNMRVGMNILIILAACFMVYLMSRGKLVKETLRNRLKKSLEKSERFHRVAFDYLLQEAKGYNIIRMVVSKDSPMVGKTLRELGTPKQSLLILSIERNDHLIPVPKGHDTIEAGDILLCFGLVETVEKALCIGGKECLETKT